MARFAFRRGSPAPDRLALATALENIHSVARQTSRREKYRRTRFALRGAGPELWHVGARRENSSRVRQDRLAYDEIRLGQRRVQAKLQRVCIHSLLREDLILPIETNYSGGRVFDDRLSF